MTPTKKGLQTKSRILGCAKELYYQKGFEGTTIQEIADRAGSTLGSMTYHFSTKAEFVHTIFSDYLAAIHDTMIRVAPRSNRYTFDKQQIITSYVYFHNIFEDPKTQDFYYEILCIDEYYAVIHNLTAALFREVLTDLDEATITATIRADFGARRECLKGFCEGNIAMNAEELTDFIILYTARAIGTPVDLVEKSLKDARRFYKTHNEELSKISLLP